MVRVKFDKLLSIGSGNTPNVTIAGPDAAKFTGVEYTGTSQAEWKDNMLSLRVAEGEDLEPCVLYTVKITLPNPYPKMKQVARQGEEPRIEAFDDAPSSPVLIDLMPMKLDHSAEVTPKPTRGT